MCHKTQANKTSPFSYYVLLVSAGCGVSISVYVAVCAFTFSLTDTTHPTSR